MKCKDAREMIEAYIDNGIDPLSDKMLAQHINACSDCRKEFELFLKYSDSIKAIKPVKAPDDFIINLNRRIESETGGLSIVKQGFDFVMMIPRMRFSMEAAGMAALVIIMLIVYKPFTVVEKRYSEIEISVAPAEVERGEVKQDEPVKFESAERGAGVAAKKREQHTFSVSDQEKEIGGLAGSAKVEEQRSEERLSISGDSDQVKMERSESAVNRSKSVYADIKQDTPEEIFIVHKVLVIKKEKLENDETGYNLRIPSDRYPLLLKDLRVNFDVVEKSFVQLNGVTTAELIIRKK